MLRPWLSIKGFLPTDEYSVEEESNKTLLFLNWISRCFVCDTGTYSDNVCVSVSLTNHSCTLHIATSRGVADKEDHIYSEQFLAVCHEVFVSQGRVLSEGRQIHHVDVAEGATKIMDCIVDRVWKRFLRKVAVLKAQFLVLGGFEHLDSLLQGWQTWRTAKGKACERSRDIITCAEHETGGDTHAMLTKVFDIILSDDSPTQSREERLEYFMRITASAELS
ncbi:hypothetical protein EDD18DRAFT_797251 [Armillaria luteobubalina]|uniref:Uncharacterized protein n=1 Tax=Armillaria luteobubalina TaxID=153913 RepID=A0AA39UJB8_9AGAR|nr:hypothetical protein EDD18DRAFT_797251 [Armillaria luteobubalina]